MESATHSYGQIANALNIEAEKQDSCLRQDTRSQVSAALYRSTATLLPAQKATMEV
jgi:hypothetical protein